ncbi:MAG: hypothetical protein U0Y68_12445 [Blastocatellia bacterium]
MRFLVFTLFLLLFLLPLQAQTQLVVSPASPAETITGTRFHYLFENEKFTTPWIEIEFGVDGKGEFRFRKKEDGQLREPIINPLQVSSNLIVQINALLAEANFLESEENYQHKKDFSHLGTITIDIARDGKQRKVTFNYTENLAMSKLANLFRNLATQETRIFELEAVRQNDPISMPAQLRFLDSELRSKSIADPERFVTLLQDLKSDESVPLIARNHAERLLKEIKKAK